MPARYADFDVRIWQEADAYVGQVMASPVGQSGRDVLVPPFGADSHEVLKLRLENAVLRGGRYRGGLLSAEEQILRQFGSELYKMMFASAPSIAQTFMRSAERVENSGLEGLRIKLTVEPPELATLPWEYVFEARPEANDQDYLCLRNKSPVVRCITAQAGAAPIALQGPLNVLGMVSNPPGRGTKPLNATEEKSRIENALRPLVDQGRVNFQWVQGDTHEHLLDMMQRADWHVFHFIGHGGSAEESKDGEGYVELGDGMGGTRQLPASQLASALEANSLRLVVLNCCDSARGAGSSSPGAALLRAGVPSVVAMQYPITDDAAVRFSGPFYNSLANGHPVEKAMTTARKAIRFDSQVEWAIPVLFTRAGAEPLFIIAANSNPAMPVVRPEAVPEPRPPTDYERQREEALEELRQLYARKDEKPEDRP